MALEILNNSNFKQFLENNKGTVLVDFYADWCGPCKMVAPILEKIHNENDDVTVVKVNVDESNELAREYNVINIPTMVVFKEGAVSHVQVGALPEAQILELLKK